MRPSLIKIEVIGARELLKRERGGIDAYCKVKVGPHIEQTAVVSNTADPVWGDTFLFDMSHYEEGTELIEFSVSDKSLLGEAVLGVARTTVKEAMMALEQRGGAHVETFYHLLPEEELPVEKTWWSHTLSEATKLTSYSSKYDEVKNLVFQAIGREEEAKEEVQQIEQKEVVPQGRLYISFRAADDIKRGVVIPPARKPASAVKKLPKKLPKELPRDRPVRVLSLDGGGVRGVLTAQLLHRLVQRYPKLIDEVDVFAGTSTGALLTLLLVCGYTPEQCQHLYEHHCPGIFSSPPARRYSPFNSKYDGVYREEVFKGYFQELTMEDLPRRAIVSGFLLDGARKGEEASFYREMSEKSRRWMPALFSNIPATQTSPIKPDSKLLLASAACRTTAAPTYFPSYEGYIDGGIFANNVSLSAVSKLMAHYPHVRASDVRVLNLGSGSYDYHIAAEEGVNLDWGLRQWAPEFRTLLLDSSALETQKNLQLMLGKGFHRIDPHLSKDTELDDVAAIPWLVEEAKTFDLKQSFHWIEEVWNPTKLE